jgi:hypothetical protein
MRTLRGTDVRFTARLLSCEELLSNLFNPPISLSWKSNSIVTFSIRREKSINAILEVKPIKPMKPIHTLIKTALLVLAGTVLTAAFVRVNTLCP